MKSQEMVYNMYSRVLAFLIQSIFQGSKAIVGTWYSAHVGKLFQHTKQCQNDIILPHSSTPCELILLGNQLTFLTLINYHIILKKMHEKTQYLLIYQQRVRNH